MTDHALHKFITQLLVGSSGEKVHKTLDAPLSLQGKLPKTELDAFYQLMKHPDSRYEKGHRQVFHTLEEAIVLGFTLNGPQGAREGLSHWLADEYIKSKEDKEMLSLIMLMQRNR